MVIRNMTIFIRKEKCMSKKKKKYGDFWGNPNNSYDNEDVESSIFSSAKRKYDGLESEITEDISRVFGKKNPDTLNDDILHKPSPSEMYIASLKRNEYEYGDENINYDSSFDYPAKSDDLAGILERKKGYWRQDQNKNGVFYGKGDITTFNKCNESGYAININYDGIRIKLSDGYSNVYYKVTRNSEDSIRYIKDDIICDDSTLRKIEYLCKYIISVTHPYALYKADEFDNIIIYDIKGWFKDRKSAKSWSFIDFGDYIAVYHLNGGDIVSQIEETHAARSNTELADILIGLTVAILDYNIAITTSDFPVIYNSKLNNKRKVEFTELIKTYLNVSDIDLINVIDIDNSDDIKDKSEDILQTYIRFPNDGFSLENLFDDDDDEDLDDEDIDDDMLSDEEDFEEVDEEDEDIEDESDHNPADFLNSIKAKLLNSANDSDDSGEEEDEEEEEDNPSDEDESDDEVTSDELGDELDDIISDDENDAEESSPEPTIINPKPIEKVVSNKPQTSSMTISVTRKTH
jgi:hypothetical protein